jgi:extradiol dioxygenase
VAVASLGYIGLETARLDAWTTFAADIVGLAVGEAHDDGTIPLRMDDYPARFLLHAGNEERLAFIGWEVADANALDAADEQLRAAGVPAERGSPARCERRGVGAMVRAMDPAGHALELFHTPTQRTAPLPGARPASGFRTGELGLGHLVVNTDAAADTVTFYTDVLGFRLSDRLDEVLFFLRCNARHHSIGVARIGGPPRLLHVMLEVNSLDDVGATLDTCLAHGLRVSSLGLHTNDRMTSFYLQTPSGFEIEYGYNGLLVDEATWQPTVIDRPSIWGHHQLDPEHPPGARAFRRNKT